MPVQTVALVDITFYFRSTEKKKIKPKPKSSTHKPINREDSEEVIKEEDDFSNFGDESSEVNVCAPPKKIIPSEKAPLQVFGHAFSQKVTPVKKEPSLTKIEEVGSTQAVLHVKCIGEKCLDKDCRLIRNEFESFSGIISLPYLIHSNLLQWFRSSY